MEIATIQTQVSVHEAAYNENQLASRAIRHMAPPINYLANFTRTTDRHQREGTKDERGIFSFEVKGRIFTNCNLLNFQSLTSPSLHFEKENPFAYALQMSIKMYNLI